MTMSEGSCSQVTLVTSSEVFREFRLCDLPRINGELEPLLPLKSWRYRETLPSGNMYSIDTVKISLKSLYSTLERIEKLVMNSEAGIEYKINSLFEDKSGKKPKWSTRPGTLRIFSQNLASYYDGKRWRKVDVR